MSNIETGDKHYPSDNLHSPNASAKQLLLLLLLKIYRQMPYFDQFSSLNMLLAVNMVPLLMQISQNFPNIYDPPPNSRCLKGDVK